VGIWNTGTGEWVRTLESRSAAVRAVAFSPDGKTIASATGRSVKLWDGSAGSLIQSLDGHTAEVKALAFSPDGKILASGSADRTIRLWGMQSHKPLGALTGHAAVVTALAFSPDGKRLASGSIDKEIRLWDAQSSKPLRKFEGHFSLVSTIAFAPDGKILASGGVDKTIRLWDAESGNPLRTLEGHASEVCGVVFSPDGALLASGSRDKTVKLWDARTGQLIRTLEGHPADVLAVAFSPDGKLLASGSYDKSVRLWDVRSGRSARALEDHSSPVTAIAFSPDGRFIASGSEDTAMKIWSPDTVRPLVTLLAFTAKEEWLAVTPDGLFDGSPEAWKAILWRFAANTFDVAPVEVFFNEFYHPGLLADILAGKEPKVTQDIAQVDRRQPQVNLALADQRLSAGAPIAARHVQVNITVTEAPPDARHPAGSGAHDVRLFRNGSLIEVWRGDVLKSQRSVTLEASVALVAGENHLTAYAFNRENIKSADDALIVQGSNSLKRKGVAYILAIGINEYANPHYNLKYAVADAQTFGDTLRQAQSKLGNFARIEVIPLLDRQATRANILAALDRLAGKHAEAPPDALAALNKIKPVEPEDAVVVYFAGHGLAQKARFYLIPHDLGYAGPFDGMDEAGLKTLLAHSISDRELEQAFEQIDAEQLLMVLDACNSGQALESEEKRRGPMNSKGLAQLAYEKGIYILTAAQGYQAALEAAELGHGYLTYALAVEGLKAAAADSAPKDGEILLREWLDYAVERVPQMQAQALRGERGLNVVFVPGEEKISDPTKRNVQRPRVFYRREGGGQPLVVDRLKAPQSQRR
ncbi:MAG TPA: caspase family protein, partial [Blastocatellia bacterium]|nr:caspase family protein [Blastocatellia bacterium]